MFFFKLPGGGHSFEYNMRQIVTESLAFVKLKDDAKDKGYQKNQS